MLPPKIIHSYIIMNYFVFIYIHAYTTNKHGIHENKQAVCENKQAV